MMSANTPANGTTDNSAGSIRPTAFEPLQAGDKTLPRSPLGQPLRWLLVLLAIAAALVMAFLLTARSVQIQVEAESPVDISIDGLHLPFGSRILIRPGDYPLRIQAEGYYAHTQTLSVSASDSQTLAISLQPLPGRLNLDSTPPGALVYIDGEALGSTPAAELSLAAGEHQLRLEAERYLSWEQVLQVTGRNLSQSVSATLDPAWADISLNSSPSGATISVDGEAIATTPATIEVLQGERALSLALSGFGRWQQKLTIEPGQAQDLGTITLTAAAGILDLRSSPSGANVTVEGEYRGQTPLVLELAPGVAQRINVSRPGYRRHNETFTLAAGEQQERSIKLQAQLGQVLIKVSPPEAVVRVNGKVVGKGSQTLSLPAFEQTVEVSLAGYATQRQRVTPRSGLEQRLTLNLATVEAAKLAKLTPQVSTAAGQTLKLFNPLREGGSEFTMGASRRDPGRRANEVLRPVALQRMFYLQTTEVSNSQFRQFQADHKSGAVQGNSLNLENQPVVNVSWQQAAQYCNWLSRKEGLEPFYIQQQGIVKGFNPAALGYRLPTEAEWAWAARVQGETLLKFPWGDDFPPTDAVENYADNTSAYVTGRILDGYTDGYVVSAPVASLKANRKGLYDLGGNVAEWVNDVYAIPAANSPRARDPMGAQQGEAYVVRGASWSLSKLSELRLSYRDYGQAGRDDVGFRLARYAE